MVTRQIAVSLTFLLVLSLGVHAALIPTTDIGFSSQTRLQNYDALVTALYANGNVTTVISTDKLWVPWFMPKPSFYGSSIKLNVVS